MRFLLLSLLALLPAIPARAQLGMGLDLNVASGESEEDREKPKPKKRPVAPFAEALYLSLSPEEWMAVELSTAAPREELSRMLQRGLYRLEFVQLVLMASHGKRPLKSLITKREEGKSLSELAKELKVPYPALYKEALAMRVRVEKQMASLPVSTSTAAEIPLSTSTVMDAEEEP